MFKLILKEDLLNKIKEYKKIKNADVERISHLEKNLKNWLEIKQTQKDTKSKISNFRLDYVYRGPGPDYYRYLYDFIINDEIKSYLKSKKIPEKDIEEFISMFNRNKTLENFFDDIDFGTRNEFYLYFTDNQPYISFSFDCDICEFYLYLSEIYSDISEFEDKVPNSIRKYLKNIFNMEDSKYEFSSDESRLYLWGFTVLNLPLHIDKNNKISIKEVYMDDEKFCEKILDKLNKADSLNYKELNKKIVELTLKGKHDNAKKLQYKINEQQNRRKLFEYYLGIIKELPSQIFSFSIPKNLLLLLDTLFVDENIENRILSWKGK